jgi:N-acetylglucosaminyl-diphospho-decaprenol L-rhamnosyltransferase
VRPGPRPLTGRRVPWAIGAFLLVRRTAWEAIGGFDERRWLYAEDLDLESRLAQAGWATRGSAAIGTRPGTDRRRGWPIRRLPPFFTFQYLMQARRQPAPTK